MCSDESKHAQTDAFTQLHHIRRDSPASDSHQWRNWGSRRKGVESRFLGGSTGLEIKMPCSGMLRQSGHKKTANVYCERHALLGHSSSNFIVLTFALVIHTHKIYLARLFRLLRPHPPRYSHACSAGEPWRCGRA